MVTTREVSVADAPAVAHLAAALLTELRGGQAAVEPEPQLVADLLAKNEQVFGFLAFADERPVGVILLAQSAALFARGTYGIITELYVVPDLRSSGVAARLIEEATGLGKRKGWSQLEVGAPRQPMWSRTLAFYLRSGFSEIGPRLRLPLHR